MAEQTTTAAAAAPQQAIKQPRGRLAELSCKVDMEVAQLLLAFETGGQLGAIQSALAGYATIKELGPHVVVIDLQPMVPARATHLDDPLSKHFTPYVPGRVVEPKDIDGIQACNKTILALLTYLKSGGTNINGDYVRTSYFNVHHQELVTNSHMEEEEKRRVDAGHAKFSAAFEACDQWCIDHQTLGRELTEAERAEHDKLKAVHDEALAELRTALKPSQDRLREHRDSIESLELRTIFDVPLLPLKKHATYTDRRFMYHFAFLGAILDQDQVAISLTYHGDLDIRRFLSNKEGEEKARDPTLFLEALIAEREATYRKIVEDRDPASEDDGIYRPRQELHFWLPLSELPVFFQNTHQIRQYALNMQYAQMSANARKEKEAAKAEKEALSSSSSAPSPSQEEKKQ